MLYFNPKMNLFHFSIVRMKGKKGSGLLRVELRNKTKGILEQRSE
jgi:hypothetical protein